MTDEQINDVTAAIVRLRDAAENLNATVRRLGPPRPQGAVLEVSESFSELTEQAQTLKAIRECLVEAGYGSQDKPPTHDQCVALVRMLAGAVAQSGGKWTSTMEEWPEYGEPVLGCYHDGDTHVLWNVDGRRWETYDDTEVRPPNWWRPLPVLP